MTLETKICGARTKDGVCMEAPVPGKTRCRLHGGLSTGARTAEGLKRISEANKAKWAERHRLIALAKSFDQAAV